MQCVNPKKNFVLFNFKYDTRFNNAIYLIGDCPELILPLRLSCHDKNWSLKVRFDSELANNE